MPRALRFQHTYGHSIFKQVCLRRRCLGNSPTDLLCFVGRLDSATKTFQPPKASVLISESFYRYYECKRTLYGVALDRWRLPFGQMITIPRHRLDWYIQKFRLPRQAPRELWQANMDRRKFLSRHSLHTSRGT